MMCSSFLCRLHVALNIRNWLCLYYVDKINRVNQLIFIFIIFMMKDHTVQCVLKTASKVIFSSPPLQAAWLKAHWSGKRVTHFSELGVSSLSLLHSPGAMQHREASWLLLRYFLCVLQLVQSPWQPWSQVLLCVSVEQLAKTDVCYQQVIRRSSFLLLFKDWCQNCAACSVMF